MSQSAAFSVTVGSNVPTWLAALSVGQWAQLSNTQLSAVAGPIAAGNIGRTAIIDAWCGACGDPVNSRYYLLGCGGHTDYSGNEVFMMDLTANTPSWSKLRGFSSPVANNVPYASDGRPVSSHTYSQQVYCPLRGRGMRVGVGSRYANGSDFYNVDGFNPITNDWDPAGTWPDIASVAASNMQDFGALYDPVTGDIYSTCQISGSHSLRRLSRATNTWSSIGGVSNGRYATGAWDTTRNRGFMKMAAGYFFVQPNGAGMSSASFTGGGPGTTGYDPSLWYSSALDSYMWKGSGSGGAVSRAPAGTMATTSFTTTGGGSIPGRSNGSHNSMQYFPSLGAALYVPSYSGNAWVLRIHSV